MSTAKAKHTQPVPKKSSVFYWPLIIILLVLSAFCLFNPKTNAYSIFNRTWGFDHIVFYGNSVKLLFFAFCLLLVVPYSNRLLVIGFSWLAEKLSMLSKLKPLLFLLLSVFAVYIFYLLRVKYYFLGDFNLRMNQTMKQDFVATEYLTMRILYHFATFGMKYGHNQEELFKLYSNIMGGFFVYISLLIADLAGKTSLQKILFFFAQTGSALVLVFCGYVEVYATPVMTLTLYLYLGLRYLYTGKGFIFVLLSLALAISCHVLCLAALPSLTVAFYFNNKHRLSFITKQKNSKIALWLSILVVLSLIISLKAKSGFLLTLTPPANQPKLLTLFSYKHFWEFFNGQVLSCGLSFFFIFALLVKSIREKKPLLSEHYFLLAMSGCFLLLVFMANLQRGSGDWDIMAFPAIGLNLVTAMLIAHLYKSQLLFAQYLMLAVIGLNAMNAFLWLEINHTDRSIRKIETMLVNDPGTYYTARITGATQVALAFTNNKLPHEAQRAALIACNMPGQIDLRPCVLYGLALKEIKEYEKAKTYFEELLTYRSPYVYEAYLYLLEYHEKKKNMATFYTIADKFFDAFYQNPGGFTGNINFRADFLIKLFSALYQATLPQNNPKRLEQIQKVIEALKTMKPAGQK